MTYSKSSNTERRVTQNPATQREELFKIQQERWRRERERRERERENIYIGIEVVKHGTRLEEEEEEAQDGQA